MSTIEVNNINTVDETKNYVVSGKLLKDIGNIIRTYMGNSDPILLTEAPQYINNIALNSNISNLITIEYGIASSEYKTITFKNKTNNKIQISYELVYINAEEGYDEEVYDIMVEPLQSCTLDYNEEALKMEGQYGQPDYLDVYVVGVQIV